MMKNTVTTLAVAVIVAFALGFALGALFRKKYYPCTEVTIPTVTRDTITTIDTVRYGYPVEVKKEIIRTDTVRVRVQPFGIDSLNVKTRVNPSVQVKNLGATDTAITDANPYGNSKPPATAQKPQDGPTVTPGGTLAIPIERKTYQGEDYKAVVEGWRPVLASIEVYPKTNTITEVRTETVIQKKRPLLGLVVGPGFGYDIEGKLRPNVSATLGLVLMSK